MPFHSYDSCTQVFNKVMSKLEKDIWLSLKAYLVLMHTNTRYLSCVSSLILFYFYRKGELTYLKGMKYIDAFGGFLWDTTPILISILTFTTYIQMGEKLTAAKVYRVRNNEEKSL